MILLAIMPTLLIGFQHPRSNGQLLTKNAYPEIQRRIFSLNNNEWGLMFIYTLPLPNTYTFKPSLIGL